MRIIAGSEVDKPTGPVFILKGSKVARDVFEDRDFMRRQFDLPGVVSYRFIGDSSSRYHAHLEEAITSVVALESIQRVTFKESRGGKYTSYQYEIYHEVFEDIEEVYRRVSAVEGTKFVI